MAKSTKATREAMRDAEYAARPCERCNHENGWHSVDLAVDPETFDMHSDTVSCKFEGCSCTQPNGAADSATPAIVHIRQRVVRKRGNSPSGDDSHTLCGDRPSTRDMSWGDTRFPSQLTYVTCDECKSLR